MTAGRTTWVSRWDKNAAVPSALGPDHCPCTESCQEGRQRHYLDPSCNLQKHNHEQNCSCCNGNSTLHFTGTFQHTFTSVMSQNHCDRPGGQAEHALPFPLSSEETEACPPRFVWQCWLYNARGDHASVRKPPHSRPRSLLHPQIT